MLVGKLIEELSKFPMDSKVHVTNTYFYPYAYESEIELGYTALVSDENGFYRVGNNIYNPEDAPIELQASKTVHILIK